MTRKVRPSTSDEHARVRALGEADLARSGLTPKDAATLRVEYLTPAETAARFPGHEQASLLLPYFELSGKVRTDVVRARLLEPPPAGAFGARGTKIDPKYVQPKGTPTAVYFPPLVPWAMVAEDPNQYIWVTEGEKKAAKTCQVGLPCLGLGGVWSFGNTPAGIELLPELEEFEWRNRTVTIAFDSDVTTKPEVAKAIGRLMEVLMRRGAVVTALTLPPGPRGEKVGLDDFLVAQGRERLETLVARLDLADGDLSRLLWRLNERYAVIRHPAAVHDSAATDEAGQPQPKLIPPGAFVSTVEACTRALKRVGDRSMFVSVAREWLEWPCRRDFQAVTYAPGKPQELPHGRLNSWLGLAVEPKKGSIKPWRALLDHLFTGAEEGTVEWLERWCGWPLKHLGTKLLSAVVVWSSKTGQGKTLVGETLGRIYGPNFVSVPQHVFESDFNGWMMNRQFVLVDDVSSHDTRTRADLLKKLITQRELLVNMKHIPEYTLPDYLNYYFTSNHGDAFYLDEHDRRLFIHEVLVGKLTPDFYEEYYAWLNGGGPAALLHYFLHELDYGDFNPTAPPPTTTAKQDMVEGVRSELDAWLVGLADLDLAGRDLWTAGELCERFNSSAVGRRVTPNAFGRRLKRFYACVGLVDDGTNGARQRYYALKNGDKWTKASGKERTKHVTTTKRF